MATDMNTWSGVGRLVRDADLKTTQGGTSVANFSIAVGYTYVSSGEKKDQTSFFNCIAWGKTGEAIAEYVKKGHRIGIVGRLQQRSWDDNEGKKRSTVEIVVDKFHFLQAKSSDTPAENQSEEYGSPFSDEDIPF